MKMVILDGHALNPGDLSWEGLAALGDLTVYEFSSPEEVPERAAGAELLFINKVMLSAGLLEALPKLRYIGVFSTGVNVVDLAAAHRLGITVCNVPDYSTDSVAQLTMALLLEICHEVGLHSASVHAGDWSASPCFCYWKTQQLELAGKTMGLIGGGAIGKRVAAAAQAFGMNVLVYGPRPHPEWALLGMRSVPLETLLAESDVVSLHCPLSEQTRHLINADTIARMKDGAILLNTARGAILDETAVADALRSGKLLAAGMDVLSEEPPRPDNQLLSAPHCFVTPHIAWASLEARTRLLRIAIENVRAFLNGTPQNVVR